MAVPLTEYLTAKGSYEGFDIVPEAIRWCRRAIGRRHPNFGFKVADLYNKTYNPGGRYHAHEFPFPYPDGSFDFVILTSVFTHLLPRDTDHYLAEISRVLVPGGRMFGTFFLLNEESLRLIAGGKSERAFAHELPDCRVDNLHVPEDAVAYDEAFILGLVARHGLSIPGPIRYGKWCGRTPWTSFQDIVVAVKE